MSNEILIYKNDSQEIEVRLDSEVDTVWLTQAQMCELFDKNKRTVSEHIRNIFKEAELIEKAVVRKNRTTASDGKTYQVNHYNLDVIISVGYRVKSQRGTQFRQWATAQLKEHLVQGYTLNEQRLKQHQAQLKNLEKTLALFQKNVIDQASLPEAQGLVEVISGYANTFILLNQFDSERLPINDFNEDIRYQINYVEAKAAIAMLIENLMAKGEATALVGNEKDDSFAGVLGAVVQSFGGEYLYPSIEAQAAHLLYFIIKNHPFSDGNKRIGAFIFIWFLQRNQHHLKQSGELKINDNALAAIALLVAQSDPAQKDLMIHLIMNLIR